MSEDLNTGPGGILADPSSIFIINVEPKEYIRLSFVFHALWENMVWLCSAETGEILAVKGNYSRDNTVLVSEINNTDGRIRYGVVAYHKHTSPDDPDAGDREWIQSRMSHMGHFSEKTPPERDVLGFNDNDTGIPPDNVRVTVTYVGGIVVRPAIFRGLSYVRYFKKGG
jgi:hypothetical protein